jgi:hypothetical protein
MERGNGNGRGRTDDEDFHRWLHQTAKSENQTAKSENACGWLQVAASAKKSIGDRS